MINKEKKKFLIITTISDSLPFFKGQLDVLKECFDVELASSAGVYLDKMCAMHSVKGHIVPMHRRISVIDDFVSLIKLIGLFLKVKPFVVHGNTPKASLLSMIAGWITRVPKRIYYVHGLRYYGETGTKRKILMEMERMSCLLATHVIAVSKGVKDGLLADGLCKKRIDLIWNGSINGIDLNYFDPAEERGENALAEPFNIDERDFVFGFVGRLVADKGINELVEAFTKINSANRNVKLLLIGNFENGLDPLKEETILEIKNHRNIINAGYQKDVRGFFDLMDVFVLPSYREGLGLVLMEAGAMNLPIISSDIVGCREVIENDVNGYLIKSKDVEELRERMQFCIDNPDELARISLSARSTVKRKFEQQELWLKSLAMYNEIVNE